MASFSLSGGLKKKYGLIVPSAVAGGTIRTKPSKRPSVFDGDNDGDDDEYDEKRFDDESTATTSQPTAPPLPIAPAKPQPMLATEAKQSKRVTELHQKALAEDENVFDYDAVYDQMKESELRQKLAREGVSQKRQSRYIQSMMQQAEERAKQEIRIRERRIHRELERELAENPELAEGHAFVTDAYKEQQELIKQMEEEERRKAEEERAAGKSFVGFYKNLLDSRSRNQTTTTKTKTTETAQILASTITTGTPTASETLDSHPERDLSEPAQLKGGINLLKKPASYIVAKERHAGQQQAYQRSRFGGIGGDSRQREREAERLSREFERQLLERQQEEQRQLEAEHEQLKAKWTRQATDGTISEAKRRYEERKRQKLNEN